MVKTDFILPETKSDSRDEGETKTIQLLHLLSIFHFLQFPVQLRINTCSHVPLLSAKFVITSTFQRTTSRMSRKVMATIIYLELLFPFVSVPHPEVSGEIKMKRLIINEFFSSNLSSVKDFFLCAITITVPKELRTEPDDKTVYGFHPRSRSFSSLSFLPLSTLRKRVFYALAALERRLELWFRERNRRKW